MHPGNFESMLSPLIPSISSRKSAAMTLVSFVLSSQATVGLVNLLRFAVAAVFSAHTYIRANLTIWGSSRACISQRRVGMAHG